MPAAAPIGEFELPFGYQTDGTDAGTQASLVISNILGIATIIAGLAFLFYLTIGAVNWITSQGDPQKLQKAQSSIFNALIGLVIIVIAYPIIYILGNLLGIPILDPETLISSFTFS